MKDKNVAILMKRKEHKFTYDLTIQAKYKIDIMSLLIRRFMKYDVECSLRYIPIQLLDLMN